jgi:hypothetical protein
LVALAVGEAGEEFGLQVHIHASYDLDKAPEALAALGSNHTQGKLAIRIR